MFKTLKTKYVIVELDLPTPILFPELLQHSHVVDSLRSRFPHLKVISAGFWDKRTQTAYGDSFTLKVESRPNEDTKMIQSILSESE